MDWKSPGQWLFIIQGEIKQTWIQQGETSVAGEEGIFYRVILYNYINFLVK